MRESRFTYYVLGETTPDDPRDVPGVWQGVVDDMFIAELAEAAASDYYNEVGDGPWPIVVVILTENGNEVGRADVELELDPVFYASRNTEDAKK